MSADATSSADERAPARPAARASHAARPSSSDDNAFLFGCLLLFLWLEYMRPDGIVKLRLQFLISVLFPFVWLLAADRPLHSLLRVQLAFLALCASAVPIATNYFAAYIVTRSMYGNIAISLGMSWLMATPKRFAQAIWAWMLIMAWVAGYALRHGGRGPGGFLSDENDLALGCCTALPFALMGFERFPDWRRWASGALAVVLVLAVIESFSRGGFVALAVTGVYYFLVSRRKLMNLGVAFVAVAAFLTLAPQKYLDEVTTITETKSGTALSRRYLWATATNMWKANPFFGVGAGNFPYRANEYQPMGPEWPSYLQERGWSGTTTHSFLFLTLAEHGAAGVGIVGYLILSALLHLRRLRKTVAPPNRAPPELRDTVDFYAPALSAAIVSYCASGVFLSVLYYPYLWYFAGMVAALDAIVRGGLAQDARSSGPNDAEPGGPRNTTPLPGKAGPAGSAATRPMSRPDEPAGTKAPDDGRMVHEPEGRTGRKRTR